MEPAQELEDQRRTRSLSTSSSGSDLTSISKLTDISHNEQEQEPPQSQPLPVLPPIQFPWQVGRKSLMGAASSSQPSLPSPGHKPATPRKRKASSQSSPSSQSPLKKLIIPTRRRTPSPPLSETATSDSASGSEKEKRASLLGPSRSTDDHNKDYSELPPWLFAQGEPSKSGSSSIPTALSKSRIRKRADPLRPDTRPAIALAPARASAQVQRPSEPPAPASQRGTSPSATSSPASLQSAIPHTPSSPPAATPSPAPLTSQILAVRARTGQVGNPPANAPKRKSILKATSALNGTARTDLNKKLKKKIAFLLTEAQPLGPAPLRYDPQDGFVPLLPAVPSSSHAAPAPAPRHPSLPALLSSHQTPAPAPPPRPLSQEEIAERAAARDQAARQERREQIELEASLLNALRAGPPPLCSYTTTAPRPAQAPRSAMSSSQKSAKAKTTARPVASSAQPAQNEASASKSVPARAASAVQQRQVEPPVASSSKVTLDHLAGLIPAPAPASASATSSASAPEPAPALTTPIVSISTGRTAENDKSSASGAAAGMSMRGFSTAVKAAQVGSQKDSSRRVRTAVRSVNRLKVKSAIFPDKTGASPQEPVSSRPAASLRGLLGNAMIERAGSENWWSIKRPENLRGMSIAGNAAAHNQASPREDSTTDGTSSELLAAQSSPAPAEPTAKALTASADASASTESAGASASTKSSAAAGTPHMLPARNAQRSALGIHSRGRADDGIVPVIGKQMIQRQADRSGTAETERSRSRSNSGPNEASSQASSSQASSTSTGSSMPALSQASSTTTIEPASQETLLDSSPFPTSPTSAKQLPGRTIAIAASTEARRGEPKSKSWVLKPEAEEWLETSARHVPMEAPPYRPVSRLSVEVEARRAGGGNGAGGGAMGDVIDLTLDDSDEDDDDDQLPVFVRSVCRADEEARAQKAAEEKKAADEAQAAAGKAVEETAPQKLAAEQAAAEERASAEKADKEAAEKEERKAAAAAHAAALMKAAAMLARQKILIAKLAEQVTKPAKRKPGRPRKVISLPSAAAPQDAAHGPSSPAPPAAAAAAPPQIVLPGTAERLPAPVPAAAMDSSAPPQPPKRKRGRPRKNSIEPSAAPQSSSISTAAMTSSATGALVPEPAPAPQGLSAESAGIPSIDEDLPTRWFGARPLGRSPAPLPDNAHGSAAQASSSSAAAAAGDASAPALSQVRRIRIRLQRARAPSSSSLSSLSDLSELSSLSSLDSSDEEDDSDRDNDDDSDDNDDDDDDDDDNVVAMEEAPPPAAEEAKTEAATAAAPAQLPASAAAQAAVPAPLSPEFPAPAAIPHPLPAPAQPEASALAPASADASARDPSPAQARDPAPPAAAARAPAPAPAPVPALAARDDDALNPFWDLFADHGDQDDEEAEEDGSGSRSRASRAGTLVKAERWEVQVQLQQQEHVDEVRSPSVLKGRSISNAKPLPARTSKVALIPGWRVGRLRAEPIVVSDDSDQEEPAAPAAPGPLPRPPPPPPPPPSPPTRIRVDSSDDDIFVDRSAAKKPPAPRPVTTSARAAASPAKKPAPAPAPSRAMVSPSSQILRAKPIPQLRTRQRVAFQDHPLADDYGGYDGGVDDGLDDQPFMPPARKTFRRTQSDPRAGLALSLSSSGTTSASGSAAASTSAFPPARQRDRSRGRPSAPTSNPPPLRVILPRRAASSSPVKRRVIVPSSSESDFEAETGSRAQRSTARGAGRARGRRGGGAAGTGGARGGGSTGRRQSGGRKDVSQSVSFGAATASLEAFLSSDSTADLEDDDSESSDTLVRRGRAWTSASGVVGPVKTNFPVRQLYKGVDGSYRTRLKDDGVSVIPLSAVFQPGDLVYGKIRGWRKWPAMVVAKDEIPCWKGTADTVEALPREGLLDDLRSLSLSLGTSAPPQAHQRRYQDYLLLDGLRIALNPPALALWKKKMGKVTRASNRQYGPPKKWWTRRDLVIAQREQEFGTSLVDTAVPKDTWAKPGPGFDSARLVAHVPTYLVDIADDDPRLFFDADLSDLCRKVMRSVRRRRACMEEEAAGGGKQVTVDLPRRSRALLEQFTAGGNHDPLLQTSLSRTFGPRNGNSSNRRLGGSTGTSATPRRAAPAPVPAITRPRPRPLQLASASSSSSSTLSTSARTLIPPPAGTVDPTMLRAGMPSSLNAGAEQQRPALSARALGKQRAAPPGVRDVRAGSYTTAATPQSTPRLTSVRVPNGAVASSLSSSGVCTPSDDDDDGLAISATGAATETCASIWGTMSSLVGGGGLMGAGTRAEGLAGAADPWLIGSAAGSRAVAAAQGVATATEAGPSGSGFGARAGFDPSAATPAGDEDEDEDEDEEEAQLLTTHSGFGRYIVPATSSSEVSEMRSPFASRDDAIDAELDGEPIMSALAGGSAQDEMLDLPFASHSGFGPGGFTPMATPYGFEGGGRTPGGLSFGAGPGFGFGDGGGGFASFGGGMTPVPGAYGSAEAGPSTRAHADAAADTDEDLDGADVSLDWV
ncbi:hypothetical protein OC844_001276 [Tilletia horrida]|nr:hypothetical protein OC844_001276 [Tilletia horrida]